MLVTSFVVMVIVRLALNYNSWLSFFLVFLIERSMFRLLKMVLMQGLFCKRNEKSEGMTDNRAGFPWFLSNMCEVEYRFDVNVDTGAEDR